MRTHRIISAEVARSRTWAAAGVVGFILAVLVLIIALTSCRSISPVPIPPEPPTIQPVHEAPRVEKCPPITITPEPQYATPVIVDAYRLATTNGTQPPNWRDFAASLRHDLALVLLDNRMTRAVAKAHNGEQQ